MRAASELHPHHMPRLRRFGLRVGRASWESLEFSGGEKAGGAVEHRTAVASWPSRHGMEGWREQRRVRARVPGHNRQERPMLGPGALNILPCPSPSLRVTSPPPGAPLLRASSPASPSEAKHTSKPSRARAQLITSLVSPSARAIYISVRLAPHLKQTPVLAPHHARRGQQWRRLRLTPDR